jgi:regulator of replication initiation timing
MSDDLEACGVVGAHFDAMPEPDVRRLCSFLLQENTELKIQNNAIQSTLKSLSKENSELKDTISDLHSKAISNHLLVQQNDDLRQTLEGLRIENEILKAENEMLKIKLADYEKRLSAVESRDEPITIREIIRVLESFICLEAAGSKTKFRKGHFNFDVIAKQGDQSVKTALATVTARHGFTPDHFNMMSYLKDCGDLNLTKAFIGDGASEDSALDDDELETAQIKKELLDVLGTYIPCTSSEVWNISDPVARPMKVPNLVLKSGTVRP